MLLGPFFVPCIALKKIPGASGDLMILLQAANPSGSIELAATTANGINCFEHKLSKMAKTFCVNKVKRIIASSV